MKNNGLFIIGTRPEIIKTYPLINALEADVMFTGQHFDKNMSEIFFNLLNKSSVVQINSKYTNLSHNSISKNIYNKVEELNPEYIVVQGDTNSTLYGAIGAKYAKKKLFYLESGLRSGDLGQIEEYNRFLVSKLADINFCNHPSNINNLKIEGINIKNIHLSGSTVFASLAPIINRIKIENNLPLYNDFILLTLHRPENTDNEFKLLNKLDFLNKLGEKILFVTHPRVFKNVNKNKFKKFENIEISNPMDYIEFIKHVISAKFIISDSGGLQEESQILQKILIIPRKYTERPELLNGYNFLAKNNNELFSLSKKALKNKLITKEEGLFYGDEKVIKNIVAKIKSSI